MADTKLSSWQVVYYNVLDKNTPITVINTAGNYLVEITLTDIYGYNTSNTINVYFTISGETSGEGSGGDFASASIGIAVSSLGTDLYGITSSLTVEFGVVYYPNLTHDDYSPSNTSYTQMIYIYDEYENLYASYNYDETYKYSATWALMPKEVGSYYIHWDLLDSDKERVALAVNKFEIVNATINFAYNEELVRTDLETNQVSNSSGFYIDLLQTTIASHGRNLIEQMIYGIVNSEYISLDSAIHNNIFTMDESNSTPTLKDIEISSLDTTLWDIYFTTENTTARLSEILYSGTYKVWISLVGFENYNDTEAVSLTFTIASRSIDSSTNDGANGTVGDFSVASFGVSESTAEYSSVALDAIPFGVRYFINIANTAISNKNLYSHKITLSGENFADYTYIYTSESASKADIFWDILPKELGVYTITLTVTGADGHDYGTLVKTYEIQRVVSAFEYDEDTLITELVKNKIGDGFEVTKNIFNTVRELYNNGFFKIIGSVGTEGVTVQSDEASNGNFYAYDSDTNSLVKQSISYDEHMTLRVYSVSTGTEYTINDEITSPAFYKIQVTFVFPETFSHYQDATFEIEFEVANREYYTTSQINIAFATVDGAGYVFDENTTAIANNRVEFGYNSQQPYFVYLTNDRISSDNFIIKYSISGTPDNQEVAYFDTNNVYEEGITYIENPTVTTWANMPKALGTYTITVTIEDLRDGYIYSLPMRNTFTIVQNTSLVFTADEAGLASALGEMTAANGQNIIPYLNSIAAQSIGGEVQTSTTLYVETAEANKLSSDFDMKDVSLYSFAYKIVDQNNDAFGSNLNVIDEEGTYQLIITFLGVDGYYHSYVMDRVIFTIEARDSITTSDIGIGFSYNSNFVTEFEFAENVNGTYYIKFDESRIGNFPSSQFTIWISVLTGTTPLAYYNYFDYDADSIWTLLPKNAGIYTIKVSLYDKEDGFAFIDSVQTYTIASATFDLSLNIEDVKDAVKSIGANGKTNAIDDLNGAMIDLLTASYFAQTAYVGGASGNTTAYTAVTEFRSSWFTFEYKIGDTVYNAENPILYGDTYSVVVTLQIDNYLAASSVVIPITIIDLTGLANGSALFQYSGSNVYHNEINLYSGVEYTLAIQTDASNEKIFGTDTRKNFLIEVTIENDFGFYSSFVYDENTSMWNHMPKMLGEYTVTVELTETLGTTTYAPTTSVTSLSIVGGHTPNININDVNIEEALNALQTKEGSNIIDDVFATLSTDGLLTLDSTIYTAYRENGLDYISKDIVAVTARDYTFNVYEIQQIESVDTYVLIDELTLAKTYFVEIIYNGYKIGDVDVFTSSTYYNDRFEFTVTERATLANYNETGATVSFVTSEGNVDSIDFNNNNETYNFVIDAISSEETTFTDNSHSAKVTMILLDSEDKETNTSYEFTYANPASSPEAYANNYNNLPKAAGEYKVVVALETKADGYITYTTYSLTIEEVSIIFEFADSLTDVELSYNKKTLTSAVSNHYVDSGMLKVIVNGQANGTIYTINNNNEFVEIDLSLDSFDITYFNSSNEEVNDVINAGDYTMKISLKDELNFGYEESYTLSIGFTIGEYNGSAIIRSVIIGAVVVAGIVIAVVITKKRKNK